tara:strand:- start:327 stop:905 length:579 start_codon:yes stop_codon:yes gene_type:complete
MKKQLYFLDNFQIPDKLYVLIIDGKIREFVGAEFSSVFFVGGKYPEIKKFEINKSFSLLKVNKYDRKKMNIKANYKISCSYLSSMLLFDSYVKLNPIEKFVIDYSKKESIFHKMNFNQKLISTLAFVTIPFIFMYYWNYPVNKNSKDLQIQSPNPDLKTINQDMKTPSIKADTVSVQTMKFERDSLKSEISK